MSTNRTIIQCGSFFRIAFARDRSGAYPAEEFLDGCSLVEQAQIRTLFRIICDSEQGAPKNPTKFGRLGDGLFEFKSFQIRMPFAYAEGERGLILVTHGFRKKKRKADPQEIERAKRILEEDAKASKILSFTDIRQRRRS